MSVHVADVLGWTRCPVDLSRLAEQSPRGTLGRRDGAGGETLPDRGWFADPQPTTDEEHA